VSDILKLLDEQVRVFLADNPDLAGLHRSAGVLTTKGPLVVIARPNRIDIPLREWGTKPGVNNA
jgi:hypothetical protein